MPNKSLESAAQQVMEAELTGLTRIQELLVQFDKDLTAVLDELGLPENFRSDVRRIGTDIRGNLSYRIASELPSLLSVLRPPESPVITQ